MKPLRVVFGLLVLADLAMRLPVFYALYTDVGMVPRWLAVDASWRWSLLFLVGRPAAVGALFAGGALAALALIANLRPRAAAWCAWAMAVSLAGRVPFAAGPLDAAGSALGLTVACALSWPRRGWWIAGAQVVLFTVGSLLHLSWLRPELELAGLYIPQLHAQAWSAPARLRDGRTVDASGLADDRAWRAVSPALADSAPLAAGVADYLCRRASRDAAPIVELSIENESARFGPFRCAVSSDSRSGP